MFMKKEHIGCLWLIGVIVLTAIIMYIGDALDIPYLKNLCSVPIIVGCVYIGKRYFAEKERKLSKGQLALAFVGLLLLFALITWLMEGRLW